MNQQTQTDLSEGCFSCLTPTTTRRIGDMSSQGNSSTGSSPIILSKGLRSGPDVLRVSHCQSSQRMFKSYQETSTILKPLGILLMSGHLILVTLETRMTRVFS